MSDIARILQQLPDDAARLRVMRWAFGRFSPEFKRPIADVAAALQAVALAQIVTPAARHMSADPAAAASATVDPDFGQQISELNDLFPERDKGVVDAVDDPWAQRTE